MSELDIAVDPRPASAHRLALHGRTSRLQLRGGRRAGEQGATLILAMAFLAIVLGGTTYLFSLAHAQSNSVQSYRVDRVVHYTADAALNAAIQLVAYDYRLGTTASTLVASPPTCPTLTFPLTYTVPGYSPSGPQFQQAFINGSSLAVTCSVTPNVTVSGGLDSDGGQSYRDVTFVVTCYTTNSVGGAGGHQSDCYNVGGGSTVGRGQNAYSQAHQTAGIADIATARVDFMPSTYNQSTSAPCHNDPAYPSPGPMDPRCRAVVPKIVSWAIYRG